MKTDVNGSGGLCPHDNLWMSDNTSLLEELYVHLNGADAKQKGISCGKYME